jgi:hypothetical protein
MRWTPPRPPYSPDSAALDFHVFGKLKKHQGGRRFPPDYTVKAEVQNWLRQERVTFYCQGLENLIVRYEEFPNKFGNLWKNTGLMSKDIRVVFLSPLNSN